MSFEYARIHGVAFATQLIIKTATFPSLRVDAELREAAESVLRQGETLTSLIETAVREVIQRRQAQEAFLARGLRSTMPSAPARTTRPRTYTANYNAGSMHAVSWRLDE